MIKKSTSRIGFITLTLFLAILVTSGSYASREREKNRKAIVESKGNDLSRFMSINAKSPFSEDFEGDAFPPDGWSLYSLLNESPSWAIDQWNNHTPDGSNSAYHTSSADGSVDSWLVAPKITVGSDGFHYFSFWSYLGNSWSYKLNSVMVSTGSPDPADEDYEEVWTLTDLGSAYTWVKNFVDLEEYVGQEIYIAFRYEGDEWGHTWYVDDIALVDDSPAVELSQDSISIAVSVNGTDSEIISINNNGISEMTFETVIEYVNSEGWLSIDPTDGSVDSLSFIEVTVRFNSAGLEPGTYEANLNINTNDASNPSVTVIVTMEVVNTNVYPFTQSFESETFPPLGWSNYDMDGDENGWSLSWFNHTLEGLYSAYHGWSWTPQDGWLVTPQISVPTEGFFYLSFWSNVGDVDYYFKNSVLVSTGSGDPADQQFVEVWAAESVTEGWVQYYINLEEYAGEDIYIAFRYEGEYAHQWNIDDISLGEEVDDSPILNISKQELSQTVGLDGSGSKMFKVLNNGIKNLNYEVAIEYLNAEDWLTANPTSGSIPAKSNQTVTLSFNATGLELGEYQARVIVSANDPANEADTLIAKLSVIEAQPINFSVIYPLYTYPTAISSNGMYVSGSQFGGLESYLWTMFQGKTDFMGDAQSVSDSGLAFGTYDTEFEYEGMDVGTAGFWNPKTKQWEFLGMNPDVPEFFGNYYNVGYGVTADGSTAVGMQWYPDYSVKAFKWTKEEGYQILSPDFSANTRANGISANGSVIYGWAEPDWIRTAAIWYNNEMIFIDNTQYGEAFGASPSGNYVTGNIGSDGFIWSPTEGVTLFQNTLNLGVISPTNVLDDGTIFGYIADGFPPTPDTRRAFVRHPDGSMETFNEYVANRGWFEASDWVFYSINDVTPDGDKFIGAAQLPTGESVSFMLDLNPGNPSIEVSPLEISESIEWGSSSSKSVEVSNVGTGILNYNSLIQYSADEPEVRFVPQGEVFKSQNLKIGVKKSLNGANSSLANSKQSNTLNYDGDNLDAIGLVSGGTFYAAARFPSEITSVYESYTLESVDVFIGDVPSTLNLIIWTAGTTTTPGEVIYQQQVETTEQSWNSLVLESPVEITGTDIWVGFEITHDAGAFVLGIDGGTTVMDGNWISENGTDWEHISNYGIPGNWNIRANLSFQGMQWLSVSSNSGVIDEGEDSEFELLFDATGLQPGTYTANLRIASNDTENPLVVVPVTLEVGPAPEFVLSLVSSPTEGGTVTGAGTFAAGSNVSIEATPAEGYQFVNWSDEQGTEISNQPSHQIVMPQANTTLTANFEVMSSVNEFAIGSIHIYPNPATEKLFVLTNDKILKYSVVNMMGQQITSSKVEGSRIVLDVTKLTNGMYLIEIQTSNGYIYKRFQVKK